MKPTILCIASYEKGQAFLAEAALRGASVVLLTAEKLKNASWPFDRLSGLHTMPEDASPFEVLGRARTIARHTHIHRVVALDEFDLEAAALIREEMRLPGMGQSTTRHFRDKLAMRVAAQRAGIPVPEFTGVFNQDDLRDFMNSVPGPWLLKPRTSASAIGIRLIESERDLWNALDELGDRQGDFLMERFLPGEVFHVDSIVWKGKLLTQAVHQYGAPPMSLMQHGGVFTTRTLPRNGELSRDLRALDAMLLPALGMMNGVTHTEFIRSQQDGRIYFLETAARVGGAFIAELVEFSTGLNPWVEWARIETAMLFGEEYSAADDAGDYAGSVICLARQQHPELDRYNDPEIVFHIDKDHHAGLIVQSHFAERVLSLTESYRERFATDFCATMPAPLKPTS